MIRTLRHRETLVYYDGPELFVSSDQLGTLYLCLLVDADENMETFLCTGISKERLSKFRCGTIDLRSIYESPEADELFVARVSDPDCDTIDISPIDVSQIMPEWFPEAGFVYATREPINTIISQETMERQTAIIHYSLNPPESRTEPKIAAETLSQGLKVFQRLLRHAYRKTLQGLDPTVRRMIDRPEYLTVNAFAMSPGSFTLHLESAALADGLGYAELSKALTRIDDITAKMSDPTATIEILKANKGHVTTAFRDLLDFIVKNDSPISYEWMMPESKSSVRRVLPKKDAEALHSLLLEREELSEEIIVLEGIVVKVDVEYGAWRILVDSEKKEYSGKCDPAANVHLGGITVETQRYRFYCTDRIEEEKGTGREKSTLLLQNYEKI